MSIALVTSYKKKKRQKLINYATTETKFLKLKKHKHVSLKELGDLLEIINFESLNIIITK